MITAFILGFIIGAIVTFIYTAKALVPAAIKKLEKEGYLTLKQPLKNPSGSRYHDAIRYAKKQ